MMPVAGGAERSKQSQRRNRRMGAPPREGGDIPAPLLPGDRRPPVFSPRWHFPFTQNALWCRALRGWRNL